MLVKGKRPQWGSVTRRDGSQVGHGCHGVVVVFVKEPDGAERKVAMGGVGYRAMRSRH